MTGKNISDDDPVIQLFFMGIDSKNGEIYSSL
jgi:hypothetical protein